ncbi:MAG: DUF4203 domain-containing protein [Luteitalea sp.]|nr:DUF4203 domain-containing protein [Luteitalea sp.]
MRAMLPGSLHAPAALFFLIGGLVSCFAGHRIFRFVLAVSGFLLGALFTSVVLVPTATGTKAILAMLAGGAAGAILLVLAEFVGVALIGAALAAIIIHFGAANLGREPHALLVLGCTVAGALAALALQRYVIVLCTAFGGAWLLVVGGLGLWHQDALMGAMDRVTEWLTYPLRPAVGYQWMLLVWFLVGVLGTFVQLRGPTHIMTSRPRKAS